MYKKYLIATLLTIFLVSCGDKNDKQKEPEPKKPTEQTCIIMCQEFPKYRMAGGEVNQGLVNRRNNELQHSKCNCKS